MVDKKNAVPQKTFRISIQTKLNLFVVLLVIVSTSVMNWIGFHFVRERLNDQIHERLETVAHSSDARLKAYVTQQLERVALIASRTRLRRYLADRQSDPSLTPDFHTGTQNILRDAQKVTTEFLNIWIADPDGRVVAATEDKFLNRDFSKNPDFQRGRKARHLGTPFFKDGRFQAHLSAPAIKDSHFLGVVMVLLDVRDLRNVLADKTGLAKTGEVLIASREGEKLRYLMPPISRPHQSSIPAEQAPALAAAIDKGSSGSGIDEYEGNTVLAAWRPIPYQARTFQKWGMIVKIDEAEAYAPISNLRRVQWAVDGILLVFGITVAILVARQFSQPILQMADTAATIAKGNLNARVPITSTDELGQLATAFNKMTEQLAQSHASLERRVERRTAELAAANEALQQSNVELQQFAYVASHDLKEPLRAISSFSDLLREQHSDQLDEKANEYLHFIVDGSHRMKNLIDDLLRYSRVSTHGMEYAHVESTELVESALSNLSEAISESQAQIELGELPTIWCDAGQLSRVFQNLIGNALKFRGSDRPVIQISAMDMGELWKFSVCDNGIGIHPEFAERIFVIFQRLHTRKKYPGTGIGLAICQRIVQRHGGKIWVERNPTQGSTFYFTLAKNIKSKELQTTDQ